MYFSTPLLLLLLLLYPYLSYCMSGGMTVETSEKYPFSVTLTNPILCGGSIISLNPPWILTAAHCIENFNINDEINSSVAYGDRNFSRQSWAQIKRVESHPMYISSAQLKSQVFTMDGAEISPYDIALIELTEPLEATIDVNRIRLLDHRNDSNSNDKLETIGMGYLGIGRPHADVLQYASCNSSHSTPLRNNNFNNSIIPTTSDANLCHGDSGSSLLSKRQEEYYLTGVLNRIVNAYDPDPENTSCPIRVSNFTDFTNLFVRPSSHIKWISEVTGLSEDAFTSAVAPSTNNNTNIFLSSSLSNGYSLHDNSSLNWIFIWMTASTTLSVYYLAY